MSGELQPPVVSATVLAILALVPLQAWSAPRQELRGTVKDRSGAVIAKALVVLSADGQEFSRVTQPDGTFVFTGVTGVSGSVTVSAPGFATSTAAWQVGQNDLSITLALARVQQSLHVTSTRTSILPSGVDDVEAQPDAAVVRSTQLQQWGALATDDKLRQVPGENLTNDEYNIGRTPVVTLGQPILVRGGLRWQSRK